MQAQIVASHKVILLGDIGVGKSTFINCFLQATRNKKHAGNQAISITSIKNHTIHGTIELNVWDLLDQETSGQICPQFFQGAHAAILMFQITERNSYKSIPNWYQEIIKNCQNVPIVLVGNKVQDKENIKLKQKQITFHKKKKLPYYNASAKANYQIKEIFLQILKMVSGDPNIMIIQQTPLKPQELGIQKKYFEQIQKQLENANKFKLLEDDDV